MLDIIKKYWLWILVGLGGVLYFTGGFKKKPKRRRRRRRMKKAYNRTGRRYRRSKMVYRKMRSRGYGRMRSAYGGMRYSSNRRFGKYPYRRY